MDRRELLALIAAATGSAFIAGCARSGPASAPTFSAEDVAFFDEVAETIIPRTDTPGARDAQVGAFIARYADACYEPGDLAALKAGIATLNAETARRYGADFMHVAPAQRTSVLVAIDRAARQHAEAGGGSAHYFTLMKQLTLMGFFTSEPGATRVARYRPVPGKYKGVVDYHPGETFWSWA